ncbi:MAG: 30S ribosomal protein S9 [Candidatus Kapaibacteriota bacterium]|jgi:small subunit ribosomal protein S9
MKTFAGTGRRKTAVAQVRLVPGTGKAIINEKEISDYFPIEDHRTDVYKPLSLTNTKGTFDLFVTVKGGGVSGQVGAVRLGISRALVDVNIENKEALRANGLLTRDPRMVERKKYGQKKARKRFQFSKR